MSGAVEKLERDFAAWLGVGGAVATGFGRSAVALALEALSVPGNDVLVPNFICTQVPEAVRRAGARPVFYPVRRDLTVSLADFEAAFTLRTRAAIVAHYFGRLLPGMGRLAAICRERTVHLVEDCALALGASAEGRRGGDFGDLAVFSFTKSDWCFGGGIVSSNSEELLACLRQLRKDNLRAWPKLSFSYGLLRCADDAANRPSVSRLAENVGQWLERLSRLGKENFYDAGRFDAALPVFAVRRARGVLANVRATVARRQQILSQLHDALQGADRVLLRPLPDLGDAGSFLLLECSAGNAEDWVRQAAGDGVTLRRCWPCYQMVEDAQASRDVAWLAEHLLVLEIHPLLTAREIERIAQTLRRLAMSNKPEPSTH